MADSYDMDAAVEWAKACIVTTAHVFHPRPINAARAILATDAELKRLREDAKFMVFAAVKDSLIHSAELPFFPPDLHEIVVMPPPSFHSDMDGFDRWRRIFNLPEPPSAVKGDGVPLKALEKSTPHEALLRLHALARALEGAVIIKPVMWKVFAKEIHECLEVIEGVEN